MNDFCTKILMIEKVLSLFLHNFYHCLKIWAAELGARGAF